MSVNGIGTAGYPVMGYEMRKTGKNVTGGSFAEQAAEVARNSHPAWRSPHCLR